MSNVTLLTPRDLADAIGVSESSVRRWVDRGEVRISRTRGGHRRIALAEAVRFIRAAGATVVRPEILGLGGELPREGGPERSVLEGSEADPLFDALKKGRTRLARGIILAGYLAGKSAASIFDGPLRQAMTGVGELWKHADRGILIEHRASSICLESIHQLRTLLPTPPADAPLALGAAPAGDVYLIPSLMAATVLRECGYRDINYGADTPLALLADAAREHQAKLVWVSVSTHLPAKPLRDELLTLASSLRKRGVTLIVGGRFAPPVGELREAGNVRVIASMSELAAFAAGARVG